MPREYKHTIEDPKTQQRRLVVGNWLTRRRRALNRSLAQAAAIGGCSNAWLNQLETGKANVFRVQIDSLPRICKAYSLTTEQVLKLLGVTRRA